MVIITKIWVLTDYSEVSDQKNLFSFARETADKIAFWACFSKFSQFWPCLNYDLSSYDPFYKQLSSHGTKYSHTLLVMAFGGQIGPFQGLKEALNAHLSLSDQCYDQILCHLDKFMQVPLGIPNPTRCVWILPKFVRVVCNLKGCQLFQLWTPYKLQEAIRAEQALLVIFGLFDVHMRLLFSRYGSEKLLA